MWGGGKVLLVIGDIDDVGCGGLLLCFVIFVCLCLYWNWVVCDIGIVVL